MTQVGGHVAEPDNLVAEVAFGRAAAVLQFVDRKAREQRLGVWGVGVAFLGYFEVAELAEDKFGGADGDAVLCEFGHAGEGDLTG